MLQKMKKIMPNAFAGTCFKNHFKEMMDLRHQEKFLKKFFYLPSTTDRKEIINQYLEKVSLTPIDCLQENFRAYLRSKKDFNPIDLDDALNREDAIKTLYTFFKKMIEVSDANLIRNVDYLVKKSTNLNKQNIKWIGHTQKRHDDSKFQLNYSN